MIGMSGIAAGPRAPRVVWASLNSAHLTHRDRRLRLAPAMMRVRLHLRPIPVLAVLPDMATGW